MNLDRRNTEIEDQAHKMWAEGSCDDEPTNGEVIEFMRQQEWVVSNVQISFDGMQSCWRWNCDLKYRTNDYLDTLISEKDKRIAELEGALKRFIEINKDSLRPDIEYFEKILTPKP